MKKRTSAFIFGVQVVVVLRETLSGGYFYDPETDQAAFYDTTEIYHSDGNLFKAGPQLPSPLSEHCMARVNRSHFIFAGSSVFAGGYDSHPVTFLYNLDQDAWSRLPDMRYGRTIASCGMALGGPNGPEFVMAGGNTNPAGGSNTSEIFNFGAMLWTTGPDLPTVRTGGASVPTGNSFLIVGGNNDGPLGYSNKIIEFDPVERSWRELDQTLDHRTMFAGATLVEDDAIMCT